MLSVSDLLDVCCVSFIAMPASCSTYLDGSGKYYLPDQGSAFLECHMPGREPAKHHLLLRKPLLFPVFVCLWDHLTMLACAEYISIDSRCKTWLRQWCDMLHPLDEIIWQYLVVLQEAVSVLPRQ
jgi:hypothetical protein